MLLNFAVCHAGYFALPFHSLELDGGCVCTWKIWISRESRSTHTTSEVFAASNQAQLGLNSVHADDICKWEQARPDSTAAPGLRRCWAASRGISSFWGAPCPGADGGAGVCACMLYPKMQS